MVLNDDPPASPVRFVMLTRPAPLQGALQGNARGLCGVCLRIKSFLRFSLRTPRAAAHRCPAKKGNACGFGRRSALKHPLSCCIGIFGERAPIIQKSLHDGPRRLSCRERIDLHGIGSCGAALRRCWGTDKNH